MKLLNRALNLQVGLFSQVQDVKQRMNHLKLMNCRKNMLREIRNRRVDKENRSGLTGLVAHGYNTKLIRKNVHQQYKFVFKSFQ